MNIKTSYLKGYIVAQAPMTLCIKQEAKWHFHNVCTVLYVRFLLSFTSCHFQCVMLPVVQRHWGSLGKSSWTTTVISGQWSPRCCRTVVVSLSPLLYTLLRWSHFLLFLRGKYDKDFFDEMYDVNAMLHSLYGVYYCQHGNGWLNMFNK